MARRFLRASVTGEFRRGAESRRECSPRGGNPLPWGQTEGEPMSQGDAATGTASDTARWAATYRARETERPDPLFRDPFARRLAGERGEEVFAALPFSERNTWLWVTRTYLFD